MTKKLQLDHIAKIEGHARLNVKIEDGEVKEARMEVFESPRFFEAIVVGRSYEEIASMTSRICGICGPSHTTCCLQAIEKAFDVKVSQQTKLLRELLNIGGWIQSHALHLFFLALPDYVGGTSVLDLPARYSKHVKRGLMLKKLGNDIVTVIGGRDVHPMTAVPGGFSKLPTESKLQWLLQELKERKQEFVEAAAFWQKLKYPKFERKTEYFSLQKKNSYPLIDGHIRCFGEKCIQTKNYPRHFKEYLEPYSTAKFAVAEGKSYMVGPLARLNLNYKELSYNAKRALKTKTPIQNPFYNNVAQAVEMVWCVDRAIQILENLKLKDEQRPEIKPKAGRGYATVEAPRGLLFHEYKFNKSGCVLDSNIIVPTAQNLRQIEDDIKLLLPGILKLKKEKIVDQLEKLIRAYDPCISCSTHFLEVEGLP
ncbi:Ni/Fe hydrogenase subunit alpha [Candidatus Woesearchaeota archaeon]|nr:Ni/Fe hydrogenase subunit alpha [Candidatus Woesearchaeota archaeon]